MGAEGSQSERSMQKRQQFDMVICGSSKPPSAAGKVMIQNVNKKMRRGCCKAARETTRARDTTCPQIQIKCTLHCTSYACPMYIKLVLVPI